MGVEGGISNQGIVTLFAVQTIAKICPAHRAAAFLVAVPEGIFGHSEPAKAVQDIMLGIRSHFLLAFEGFFNRRKDGASDAFPQFTVLACIGQADVRLGIGNDDHAVRPGPGGQAAGKTAGNHQFLHGGCFRLRTGNKGGSHGIFRKIRVNREKDVDRARCYGRGKGRFGQFAPGSRIADPSAIVADTGGRDRCHGAGLAPMGIGKRRDGGIFHTGSGHQAGSGGDIQPQIFPGKDIHVLPVGICPQLDGHPGTGVGIVIKHRMEIGAKSPVIWTGTQYIPFSMETDDDTFFIFVDGVPVGKFINLHKIILSFVCIYPGSPLVCQLVRLSFLWFDCYLELLYNKKDQSKIGIIFHGRDKKEYLSIGFLQEKGISVSEGKKKRKRIFRERMRDTLTYINEYPEGNPDMKLLARRLSYSSYEFAWMLDIFFELPWEELAKRKPALPNDADSALPWERQVDQKIFLKKYVRREKIILEAKPIVSGKEASKYTLEKGMDYVESMERESLQHREWSEERFLFWWHDASYQFYYLVGTEMDGETGSETEKEGGETIRVTIPASDYIMFTIKDPYQEKQSPETVKGMLKYALAEWEDEKGISYDHKKYYYISYSEGRYSVFFPLSERIEEAVFLGKKEKKRRIYGVDEWTKYIDRHIKENLTVEGLAKEFHYSLSHFRHVFRIYYAIGVNDYIRKRKVQCAADEIREGKKPAVVAAEYGFKSRDGFNRAFKKEFAVSPSKYQQGKFEVVDLRQYYSEFKGQLKISYLVIDELKMIGRTVIPDRGDEVDIPAQIAFWIDRDFPSIRNMRRKNNTEIREDKIAMWYHDEDCINIEYILGPVVSDFQEVPEDMIPITICGGEYIVFETNKDSDRENIAETIRMFSRCVFFGWIQENRDQVDFNRFTFERYVNDKVYIYVPRKK